VALGLLTFVVVDDTPAQARWLSDREKAFVLEDLSRERREEGARKHSFVGALRLPRVWLLTIVYFCLVGANPTLGFWGGIALINSIGNLSGWLGPFMVGWLKDLTGRTSTGLYVVAGLELAATILIVRFMPRARRKGTADGLVKAR
jgi:nitrate/nitrite transporter NarK